MKPTRVLPFLVLLPLLVALWAILATESHESSIEPEPTATHLVPAPAELPKPLPGLTSSASDTETIDRGTSEEMEVEAAE